MNIGPTGVNHRLGKVGPWRSRRGASRRRWPAAALAAACALVVAACGGSGSSSAGGGTVVVGYENNGADPQMVSIAKNYFQQDMGTTPKLQIFESGPAALSAVASGALQFMCGLGVPPTISAMAKGVPLEVVFNQERYTTDAGLVVKSGSGIHTPADLKGKTLAIVIGSQSTFELARYLQGSGITPADVHQLNMSPQQMQSSWTTGAIDAAIVWDPVFDYLSTHGGTVLKTDADLPPAASSYNICVANKDYASANPKIAAGFVKAMGDGATYAQTNRQDALALMAKQAGIDVATADKQLAGYQIFSLSDQVTPTVLGTGSGVANSATAQSLLSNWKVLKDGGFLPTPPPSNAAQYVNSSYAATALGGTR